MRGVIFSGGTAGNPEAMKNLLQPEDRMVCADGGYLLAERLGVMPEAVLGDMDSLKQQPKARVLRASCDKDETDTQLCLDYLLEAGCGEIVILGALGGREDHTYANLMLTVYGLRRGVKVTLADPPVRVFAVTGQAEIEGKDGDLLSLFPVGGNTEGILTEGLKYPLQDETLYFDVPRGISNVFAKDKITVRMRRGILLAMHTESGFAGW